MLNLDSPAPVDRHGESLGTVHLSNLVQTAVFIVKMFLFLVGRYFSYCTKVRLGKIAKNGSYVQKVNRFWATFFDKVVDLLWNLKERWGLSRDFREISTHSLQQVVTRFRDCAQEIELVCCPLLNVYESIMKHWCCVRMDEQNPSRKTSPTYTVVYGQRLQHSIGVKK